MGKDNKHQLRNYAINKTCICPDPLFSNEIKKGINVLVIYEEHFMSQILPQSPLELCFQTFRKVKSENSHKIYGPSTVPISHLFP